MYIGNIMLLGLNLPLIGMWVRLLTVPYHYLAVVIVIICVIGAYSINSAAFDVGMMMVFGVVGYFLRRWKYPVAPFIIGVVLGPTTENSLRQTLLMFKGDASLIGERPLAMALLVLAAAVVGWRLVAGFRGRKLSLNVEEGKSL